MRRLDIPSDLINKRIWLFWRGSHAIPGDEHDLLRRIDRRLEFLLGFGGEVKDHARLPASIFFVAQAGADGHIERLGHSDRLAIQGAWFEMVFGDVFERKHVEVGAERMEKKDIAGFSIGVDDKRKRDFALLVAGAMVVDIWLGHLVRQ